MRKFNLLFLLMTFLAFDMSSCEPSSAPNATPVTPTPTRTATLVIPTLTSAPTLKPTPTVQVGEIINVTSLQAGNPLPRFRTQTRQSNELADNRIGDMYGLGAHVFNETPDSFVNRTSGYGYKWMRISLDAFDWSDVAKGTAKYSAEAISPEQDEAITLLAQNGIKILYCLVYWDEKLGIPRAGHPRFASQEEIDRYLDYVRFIVRNLKDRVEYFEIFNEPNYSSDSNSQQNIRVNDYIELVRQTIPVIRAEDPQAKIVVGGTSLADSSWRPYLFSIVLSDIMPQVDAISWHAGGAYTAAYPETRPYYYEYPNLVQAIKDTATAHGFTGEYIAAELQAWQRGNTECDPCYPWVHGYIEGAKYLGRGLIKSLGMDLITGTADQMEGEPKKVVVRNITTIMAGARPISLTAEIQSEATDIVSYAFSLPNGDRLFALWSDGVAVDGDVPGVSTILTFPGLSAQKVIGVDVLNGFEQELLTQNENGNLVIQNLMVQDYPVILRISGALSP